MRFSFEGEGCFPTGKHYPGIAHLMKVAAVGLLQEFDAQTPLDELPLVSIDTETTGRDAETDRIVEIACVILVGGEVRGKHSWLVNPGCPIPQEAYEVHGISDADVQDKPAFQGIVEELTQVLQGVMPVAYNAEFDQRFILAELDRLKSPLPKRPPAFQREGRWLDPLVWARELHADAKSKSLSAMAELLGVELETAHRATDDALAAGLVLIEFMKDRRVPNTYGAFLQEQNRLSRLQGEQRQYWRS